MAAATQLAQKENKNFITNATNDSDLFQTCSLTSTIDHFSDEKQKDLLTKSRQEYSPYCCAQSQDQDQSFTARFYTLRQVNMSKQETQQEYFRYRHAIYHEPIHVSLSSLLNIKHVNIIVQCSTPYNHM
jgi:hypothetical protein